MHLSDFGSARRATIIPSDYRSAPWRAFMSDDCCEILRFAAESAESGDGAALVALTDIRGGAARALGAQMAVRGDGAFCGYVSGGCTEAAVAAESVAAIWSNRDRVLHLGAGSPFFDIVLPCGGGISLAIHVVRRPSVLRGAVDALARREHISITYRPSTETMSIGENRMLTGWEDGDFIRTFRARARLQLVGDGIEAMAVAQVARAAGYEVISVGSDDRLERVDQDTAIAFVHHDLERELPKLVHALRTDAFYVGALGSSKTHLRRCAALAALGFSSHATARIKAPIGIFPKARDSGTLALAIVADIAAARTLAGG